MDDDQKEILNKASVIALKSAIEAGKFLLSEFNNISQKDISAKSRYELITSQDVEAEKKVLARIKEEFPGHGILAEESGRAKKTSDYLWVVDPLDGTSNYIMGNPLFAVSAALLYKNEPMLGVVYAPYLGEIYMAEKGQGATLGNKKIVVNSQNKLSSAILTFCHGSDKKEVKRAIKMYEQFKLLGRDMRQLGSASLECCFVASGKTSAIMISGVKPWDVAAGALIVREAGGKVTDFSGKEWNINSQDILASNNKIHGQLLKILKEIK